MQVGDLVTWRGRIYMVFEIYPKGGVVVFNPRTGNTSLLSKEHLEVLCK